MVPMFSSPFDVHKIGEDALSSLLEWNPKYYANNSKTVILGSDYQIMTVRGSSLYDYYQSFVTF